MNLQEMPEKKVVKQKEMSGLYSFVNKKKTSAVWIPINT